MGRFTRRLHISTLSELEIFQVGRALRSIIDWSTVQDTTSAHTILLVILLGKNYHVVSVLITF